jgi:hypothetical protein
MQDFFPQPSSPTAGVSRIRADLKQFPVAVFLLLTSFCMALPAPSGPEETATSAIPVVEVRFFFHPGCDECAHVTNHVIPLISAQFGAMVLILQMPVDAASNRIALLEAMNRDRDTSNERVYMDVNRRHLIAGADAIEKDLATTINLALSEPPPPKATGPADSARSLAARFTVPGVLAAGIFDSINPCAIAALIFLVSVLTLARERPVNVLAAGIAYCCGVFVTYTAIGFGLLQAIRTMQSFPTIRMVFDFAMCCILLVLAVISFRDAARARSGAAGGMTLRLPDSLSVLVRATLRTRFKSAVGLASAFLAGCLVTAIETVCTGQVYGPTLAIIVAQGGSVWRESGLLLLYNLMFVMPLLFILILAWRGMAVSRLLAWSARNAVTAKLLMGMLFLALLAFLILARFRW